MRKFAAFVIAALVVVALAAEVEEKEKAEAEEVRTRVNQLIEALNKNFDSGFRDYASSSIQIDLPPDRQYRDSNGVEAYLSEMSIAKATTRVTSTINVSAGSAAFKKEMSGTFKNGCEFFVSDVVQVIRFDSDLNKVEYWTEFFPRKEFFKQQQCPTAKRVQKDDRKDEL